MSSADKMRKPCPKNALTARELQFARVMVETNSQTEAARAIGFKDAKKAGYRWAHRPHVEAYVVQLRELIIAKVKEQSANAVAKKIGLTVDFLDEQLMKVAEHGGGHEYRGEADRVKAIEVGYKRMQALEPAPPPQMANQTQVNVITGQAAAAAMYMPKWVREQLGIDRPIDAAIEHRLLGSRDADALGTEDAAASGGTELPG